MQDNFLEKYFEFLDNKDTSIEEDLIQIKGRTYSTKVSTFNEYVAFLNLIKQDEVVSQEWDTFRKKFDKVVNEGLGGYLSVYFGQEFGTIGEILGLSKQDGEEVKKCYMKYLDVFTSYYKTARGHSKNATSTADQKGKGKLEHFKVKLEDTEDEEDSQPQPIHSHYTRNQNLQGMITGQSTSRKSDSGDSSSNISDDFTIIT
nr:ARID DNA-binding domain-containing protein [Tanacetum cinerariifolium]GEX67950.1 ARID DNA-binding domain-containing protein [Tanacetum cinerariifolium]GEX96226.1 ARID DNA-binding domain-containing protein [Tanacetum cinerariifolium]